MLKPLNDFLCRILHVMGFRQQPNERNDRKKDSGFGIISSKVQMLFSIPCFKKDYISLSNIYAHGIRTTPKI